MLRVYTPASPHPTNSGRSPLTRSSHAEGLRKQIVDMVQQQGLTTSDAGIIPLEEQEQEPEVIYQIKKKGGIASVRESDPKTDRKNDKLKKIHLKILRETRGKGTKSFSAFDDQLLAGVDGSKTSNTTKDPDKRPMSFSGLTSTELKQKNLKPLPVLKSVDENKENKPNNSDKSAAMNSKSNDSKYEVRGSAIKNNSLPKSAPVHRSAEASRRHMTIHTSLQMFKRRLKVSQPDFYIHQKVSTNEADYVIRRVPLKNSKVPPLQQQAPIEPRLKVNSATSFQHRSRTPVTQSASPHPLVPMSRPNSGTDRDRTEFPEKKIRCSYRLPDNINWSKEVSFRDDTEMIPNVNTYVLEQAKKSNSKFDGQATLSTHNVDVHNALTSTSDTKVKLGENNEEFDSRFLKWLQESTAAYSKDKLRSSSASSVRIRSPDFEKEKIEILDVRYKTSLVDKEKQTNVTEEIRCKTPFPDTD